MRIKRVSLNLSLKTLTLATLLVGIVVFTQRTSSNKSFTPGASAAGVGNLVYWGARMDGEVYQRPGDAPWDDITWSTFESHAGKKASIIHWGATYPTTFNYNLGVFQKVKSKGALTLLSYDTSTIKLSDFRTGAYDVFFRTFAQQAAASKIPFFFRLDWEMDGSWFNWGTAAGNPKGNTAADFKDMWIRLHNIFVANGATNVTWVWCPYARTTTANPYPNLYPGNAYVDWTCFDTYNWSTLMNKPWQNFNQITKASYDTLMALAPTKPIMIGEFASSEKGAAAVGTSKAQWIADALWTYLPTYFPNIRAIVWFNWNNVQNNQRNDWPIESSPAAQDAFKNGISSAKYVAGSPALSALPPTAIKPPVSQVTGSLSLSNTNPPKGTKVNLRVQASSMPGNANYFEIYLHDYRYPTNPTPAYNWSLIYSKNLIPSYPTFDLTYGQNTGTFTSCINTDGSNLLCNYLNGNYPGKYDFALKVSNSFNDSCATSVMSLPGAFPDCGPTDFVTLTVQ